jgi:hypothetical protein
VIPATQTIQHDPANGAIGDCFRATLASLLHMRTEDVPHFLAETSGPEWLNRCNEWLAQFDLSFIEFEFGTEDAMRAWADGLKKIGADVFCTLCGPSPRFPDEKHSVVGYNGEPVHDPHPSRAMLAGPPTLIGLLVKRCAAESPSGERSR